MKKFILSLDQGTSSSRSIIFDQNANIISSSSISIECKYPKPGWVEQDPEVIWESQLMTIKNVLTDTKTNLSNISAVGITNQRETTIAWNRITGKSICPAISWQCKRTTDICEKLKVEGFDKYILKKTGLVTDPYFSATKIYWILKNYPEAQYLTKKK